MQTVESEATTAIAHFKLAFKRLLVGKPLLKSLSRLPLLPMRVAPINQTTQ